jgi:PKD repeat protein
MRRKLCWLALVLAVTAGIAISSARAQTTQTPQLAYASAVAYQDPSCCPSNGACDASCPYYDFDWYIVTPHGSTRVLGETRITWSGDGTKIAFAPSGDISVADADGANAINITNTANNWAPAWSPTGPRIAFVSTRDNLTGELYLMNSDGSNVVRLTYDVASSVGYPAWSQDGTRIAFNCQLQSGNDDICAINPDGTGFARLTSDPASDSFPSWSPDGLSIAFSTTRYGNGPVIAVMNADGSDVTQVGSGINGSEPAWSPDGSQIAFDVPHPLSDLGYDIPDIYLMQGDGGNVAVFQYSAGDPAWMPAHVPIATFKVSCAGSTCDFNASGSKDSYGTIISYAWSFGDGTAAAGSGAVHTYAAGSNYTVKLVVTDNTGATGTKFETITINSPPVAFFAFLCNLLTCNFDGSGSGGIITSYVWNFGDGTMGLGPSVSHAYAAGGQYSVTLTVTDNASTSNTQSHTVIANSPPTASFSFSCNGLTCTFNGSASKDSDGTITNYAWRFGDGRTGTGATIKHSYAPGMYTVTLTVTDNGGATGVKSNSVTVPPKKGT